jgi:hypothetical protein
MFKKLLIICLAISFLACDDESSDNKDSSVAGTDSSPTAGAGTSDAGLPMQYYDFDTMEIEPDQDAGPDMDD